jgi:hypothetical protein
MSTMPPDSCDVLYFSDDFPRVEYIIVLADCRPYILLDFEKKFESCHVLYSFIYIIS